MKIMLNTLLKAELRIDAMIAFFDTIPSMGSVNVLARLLRTEPNLQVAHFGYTLMRSLSKSTIPDRQMLYEPLEKQVLFEHA